jgi:hypothetical protein
MSLNHYSCQNCNMRNIFFLVALLAINVLNAQSSPDDQLDKRLAVYMRLNKELKFEELMNYVHPSLFKIASKEQLIEVFQKTFDNDLIKMSIDSTAIVSLSAPFQQGNATYKKITYFMTISVVFKDSLVLKQDGLVTNFIEGLKKGFPGGQVAFHADRKVFTIQATKDMLALRDSSTAPWTFLGIENNNPQLVQMLFPEAVITHFNLL